MLGDQLLAWWDLGEFARRVVAEALVVTDYGAQSQYVPDVKTGNDYDGLWQGYAITRTSDGDNGAVIKQESTPPWACSRSNGCLDQEMLNLPYRGSGDHVTCSQIRVGLGGSYPVGVTGAWTWAMLFSPQGAYTNNQGDLSSGHLAQGFEYLQYLAGDEASTGAGNTGWAISLVYTSSSTDTYGFPDYQTGYYTIRFRSAVSGATTCAIDPLATINYDVGSAVFPIRARVGFGWYMIVIRASAGKVAAFLWDLSVVGSRPQKVAQVSGSVAQGVGNPGVYVASRDNHGIGDISSPNPFNGFVGDVVEWGRALSDDEIVGELPVICNAVKFKTRAFHPFA